MHRLTTLFALLWCYSVLGQTNPQFNPDYDGNGFIGVDDVLGVLGHYDTPWVDSLYWSCGDLLNYQGYDYKTVLIGEHCWFAENLRVQEFRNGDELSIAIEDSTWLSGVPACCPPNGEMCRVEGLGFLYNGWSVEDSRRLCPSGWHVSSDIDWFAIETMVGIDQSILETSGWRCTEGACGSHIRMNSIEFHEWAGMNNTGFSALPAGRRQWGEFGSTGGIGGFWCTTDEFGNFDGIHRSVFSFSEAIYRGGNSGFFGFSVRCVQDSQ